MSTVDTSPSLDASELAVAAAACGVLHNVFYFKPTRAYLNGVGRLRFLEQWPAYGNDTGVGGGPGAALLAVKSSLENDSLEAIEKDYYRLFIGPGGMEAYPWGSVYTDRENLVCGETTRAFKRFCVARGIQFNTGQSEPEDHIGLVIGALSRLFEEAAATGDLQDVSELLGEHLLPWGHRALEKVRERAETGYYRGFAALFDDLLTHWRDLLDVSPRELQLFA